MLVHLPMCHEYLAIPTYGRWSGGYTLSFFVNYLYHGKKKFVLPVFSVFPTTRFTAYFLIFSLRSLTWASLNFVFLFHSAPAFGVIRFCRWCLALRTHAVGASRCLCYTLALGVWVQCRCQTVSSSLLHHCAFNGRCRWPLCRMRCPFILTIHWLFCCWKVRSLPGRSLLCSGRRYRRWSAYGDER